MNHRNTWMALSLVLLAGASRLAGQTAQNPVLVVFGSNPDAIQFSHQIGTTNPLPQSVRVYSGPPNVPFTATANPQTVGGWLFVNGALTTSGTTAVQGQQDLSISVTPQGLAAGSYTGTVNIVAGSTTRSLNVLLTVSGSPQLRISPASMPDQTVERNGAVTLPLTVASTSGTAIPYTVIVAAQEPLTNWLSVSAPVPQTGQPAQVTINAALIPATTTLAIGALRFTSPSNGQVTLPISVIVTPGAQLQTSPNNINFPYEIGRSTPSAKGVTVTSSTQTQILYGATVTSNSPWLTLSQSPNGPGSMTVSSLTTPSVLYLIPNIGAVPATPATLDATVVISQPGGTVSRTITARLIISNQAQFTLTQDSAQFSYTLGGVLPNPASISLGSTSIPLQFTTASTFTTGGAFFSATPTSGATPQNLTISLDPTRVAALTAGTYTGSVRVTSTSGASPIDIPVTFTVSGSALLTVDNFQPDPFEGAQGQALAERSVVVRSTDSSNQPFTVNVEYGTGASNWLILSPSSGSTGTTSGVIRLNVNTQPPLPPGSYTATLVITPTGVPSAPALRIPIRYNVTGSINVTANPLKLDLTQIGNTPPAVQTITLASTTSNST
ncbi:MAG: hypothetical protein H7Y20_03350, partial [Bryobacteraceae bacterium]|nr:hypothetical protein [Bryobacteraceae bacterium]